MASSFYPEPLTVPERLETAVFTLRPLTPAHVELDYAAVMGSKEMLRVWSGSQWPWDSFTLADNLSDLEWHHEEHLARIAFTYTILNPDESECLGCLYTRPLLAWQASNPNQLTDVGAVDATTRFWVKTAALATGLEQTVLNTLQLWFKEAWQFRQHSFHVRAADSRQVQFFENSLLTQLWILQSKNRGGEFYFYG